MAPPASRTPLLIAATLAIAAAGTAAAWHLWLRPQRDVAALRAAALNDVGRLYALQLKYRQARGAYASDLDSLLSAADDRADFKTRLSSHVDLNTLAVVGDASRFRIEANVLDADRTLLKIKGPVRTYRVAPSPADLPTALPATSDGAPIAPAR
jgi:hypothetical protein